MNDDHTTKKILIVEDEMPLTNALADELKREGYSVTKAKDGKEGLATLSKHKFDLILLDIVMPKVDGFKMLETMKEKKYNIPTVVLSNLDQGYEIDRAKKLGAIGFLVKSNVSLKEVVEYIKAH